VIERDREIWFGRHAASLPPFSASITS